MSERKTPLCPMLFVMLADPNVNGLSECSAKCIGSDCAWWVPKTYTIENTLEGAMFQRIPMRDNSQGICAKNEHADPWPDPATREDS